MPRLREFRFARWMQWTATEFDHDGPEVVAFDTETTGLGFYDEPFAATLTWRDPAGTLKSGYVALEGPDRAAGVEILRGVLLSGAAVVGHNWKFDAAKAALIGAVELDEWDPARIHDTQTMWTLLDENSEKGLKKLAVRVLGIDDTIEVEVKSGPNKGTRKRVPKEQHRLNEVRRKLKLKKEDGYHLLPREVLIPYALRDTEFTLRLYEVLSDRLDRRDDSKLLELYRASMELKLVLLRMEADGFRLDMEYLNETTSDYGVKVMHAWNDVVALTGDPDLNPQSPDQLKAAFAKRGIHLDSTAEAELVKVDDDLARTILEYRAVKKIHSVYLTGMRNEQKGGLIHPHFNDDGARTGRMSSGKSGG